MAAMLSSTTQALTSNGSGTNNGFYYMLWHSGGTVNMTLGSAGNYSVQWSNVGDMIAGKGWNPGSGHTVNYNASSYQNSGGGALALYGWTTNPLVEYYIAEKSSGLNMGTFMGTVVSDAGIYNIYKHQVVSGLCIYGTANFWQYISIRQTPRTSGAITVQNHFNKWTSMGMNLGTQNFQIMAVESWTGSGYANVTVW